MARGGCNIVARKAHCLPDRVILSFAAWRGRDALATAGKMPALQSSCENDIIRGQVRRRRLRPGMHGSFAAKNAALDDNFY